MFLLILARTLKTGQSNPDFTFHNGSINTRWNISQAQALDTLHSTMFLLILLPDGLIISARSFFTFHNVSINTFVQLSFSDPSSFFTFHNVSINTGAVGQFATGNFSLHSTMFLLIRTISARSLIAYFTLHSTMFLLILGGFSTFLPFWQLYIPQCFY